jgi:uncharacterized protein
VRRVVLDTNTVISALLFSGIASRLVAASQSGAFRPLLSKEILDEYVRVLAYPKFELTAAEIRALVEEEILPSVDTIRVRKRLRPPVSDRDDHKFLECAVAGRATCLVTGDRQLRTLGTYRGVTILNAAEFLSTLAR